MTDLWVWLGHYAHQSERILMGLDEDGMAMPLLAPEEAAARGQYAEMAMALMRASQNKGYSGSPIIRVELRHYKVVTS